MQHVGLPAHPPSPQPAPRHGRPLGRREPSSRAPPPVGSDAQAQAITPHPARRRHPGFRPDPHRRHPPTLTSRRPANGTCTPGTTFPAGATCSLQVAFHPTAPGERPWGAVVLLDRDRKTLASQFVTALATGPILTFIPGTINTVAGDAAWIYAGDGVAARPKPPSFCPSASPSTPPATSSSPTPANNRIRRVDGVSRLISTFAGTRRHRLHRRPPAPPSRPPCRTPPALALDPPANSTSQTPATMYPPHRRLHRRHHHRRHPPHQPPTASPSPPPTCSTSRIPATTSSASSTSPPRRHSPPSAGRGTAGYSGDGGPSVQRHLQQPVVPSPSPPRARSSSPIRNNHRIRSIAPGTGLITTIAGTGQAGFSGDTGPANLSPSSTSRPPSLSTLPATSTSQTQAITASAKSPPIPASSPPSPATPASPSPATSGRADLAGLYGPYTLALDSTGSLLIADVFHNRVRRISAGGDTLDYPDPARRPHLDHHAPDRRERRQRTPRHLRPNPLQQLPARPPPPPPAPPSPWPRWPSASPASSLPLPSPETRSSVSSASSRTQSIRPVTSPCAARC